MRNGFLGWWTWRRLLWVGLFLAALAGALEWLQPWQTEWISAPDGRLWRNTVYENEGAWHAAVKMVWLWATAVLCGSLVLSVVELRVVERVKVWWVCWFGKQAASLRYSRLPVGATPEPANGWKYWCLVLLATLLIGAAGVVPALLMTGNTLWVDAVNGSDISGRRGTASSAFRTIGQAKTNAVAGDTIFVLSGNYTNNNLLKAGVNYFFFPGARVWWADAGSGAGYGFFDDRATGATTNTIGGQGEFQFDSPGNVNVVGAVVTTNRLTNLKLSAYRIGLRDLLGASAVSGCIAVKNCQFVSVVVDELYDQDFALLDSYSSGIYWEAGETHITANRIKMDDGYTIWAKEVASGTTNGLWVTANQIWQAGAVGGTASIEIDALTDPFRVWIDAKEITCESGAAFRQAGGGRVYVRAEKMNSLNQFPVQLAGGNLWLDAQKLTGKGWIQVSGGFLWGQVGHFEDLGGTSSGIVLTGGTNYFRGGNAIMTNGPCVKWGGGVTRLEGMVLTTVTNTAATGRATNASVMLYGTNSATANLTLNNCTLNSGGTNSIFTTNTTVSCTIEGGYYATNATHPNVVLTNASVFGGGYAITSQTAASVNPAASTTTYFLGDGPGGANSAYTNASVEIPRSGVIRRWSLRTRVQGTLASAGTANHFLRLNDATDFAQLDQNYSLVSTNTFVICNQPVNAGDMIAVKFVAPAWVTAPTTVRWFVTIWIE